MRVFRQIVVVGVGAAITFSNAGQGASAQPPAQSQDSSSLSNPIELAQNIRSTSNTASEPTSEAPEQSIAQNPPTSDSQQPGEATIAATLPTESEQASKPQQAAPAAPSTQQEYLAQSPTPAPANTRQKPVPSNPSNVPAPNLPAPVPRGTPNETFPPLTPKGILDTKPPATLEPNPNPLQFPTKPEDVRIEEVQSITLQQAIDLARRNSQVLQIAQKQVEQSRSGVREQQAALFPDLTFQMAATRQVSASGQIGVQTRLRQNANLPASRQLPTNSPEFQNFGTIGLNNTLQLSYDLDIFGRRNANIRAAREQLRFRELDLERQAEQLRFDTAEAYYNLQNSDGQVAIRQASVRNAQQSLRDAEALERAGVGTRFAVLQAQSNVANEVQQLSVARRDQRVAQRRLAEILNISQSANLTAADPVEQAGSWRLSLEESIVQAFKNRPELEQQLVQRNISQQQRRSIRAGGLPQVNVTGSYNFQGLTTDDTRPFSTRGWASGYAVQANLTWNFFDGGAVKARVKQRDADISIAESRFDQIRNQVRREVEQAYFGLESSFENIETSEAGVLQSREALRLARLRFQAGVGTQTDVIQAETDLTRAERNRLSAIVNYNLGLSSLQRAVSNLPTNNLSDAP
ncbi:MAG: TolC family protein [Microcoleus sp. PH2017_10_PVI_O_A]|uniref:TolC family protein n=1 Tax=unclassified Microcoleus TaxID=2642155 RepID=UPI001DE2E513|nr:MULTISPECIES: TolC family protein [unclassified Microcoleus]TAE79479.1 MAG: transporter [Oscillatoriales cyanobacterium]MCC3408233.1 TolC family protein [Microcoleus sp. PH2017_10_PVI_O_A]MCC3462327.1 TolC family protein [Microcoleus sp. PH2017_11_PCY_U_A]MCC3480778.1 TolC family protein [Microcoleus sp. PH2017_12_PCY_D_A]MCC3530705.1 TolC family protein [Microcoleus sp. PH2017_21_RUC_O_A]